MIEMVWEFLVKEEAGGQFELTYGPGGAWSTLFADCPGFRGTTVLRDAKNLRRYLVIDLWDAEDQREQVLAEREDEYAKLESDLADWTESKMDVGIFRVLSEATVRARGKVQRRKIGEARRKGRRTMR
jgi:heme-degrading monooxygenase HmoA